MKRHIFFFVLLCMVPSLMALNKTQIADTLNAIANREAAVGHIKVNRIRQNGRNIEVYASPQLSCVPFTKQTIELMRKQVSLLTLGNSNGKVLIYTDGREISELVHGASGARFTRHDITPLRFDMSSKAHITNGLQGRYIATYGSHGIYYNQQLDLWKWQRAKILTTVEDVYTTAYTMHMLVPMLENAGAIVLQPRERDTHSQEVVIDDTDCTLTAGWQRTNTDGFAIPATPLLEKQNPFTMGGYSYHHGNASASSFRYSISMPSTDDYALYISFKTLPNSTEKAVYTVMHEGVTTYFHVNQRMGGSTWIYLGTFRFGSDTRRNYVEVSSLDNGTLTSDAIKVGGGMGSVARYPNLFITDNIKSSDNRALYDMLHQKQPVISQADSLFADSIARLGAYTSSYPRWLEGARYFMQYSGIPDSVYNFSFSHNDYIDDYASRGRWANYLAGGSEVIPDAPGLGIPIDLFLAFHSDAGSRTNDSIIGTLAIYTDFDNDKNRTYANGASRLAARDYADLVQTQIVGDMQALYAPEWQRRQLLNSSYSESRNPKMPAMLLELLSHQNFADMRYGLDPRVRLAISRSIYKGMLKFLAEQYGKQYVVQPLPVKSFAIDRHAKQLRLTWQPQDDPLEPSAKAQYYIVYTREGNNDWDNGFMVNTCGYSLTPIPGKQYDFYVVAANDGGISMPSEVLSACLFPDTDKCALIINGFTRLAAPDSYADSIYAGFIPSSYGVPYKKDVCYIGAQYEFRRDLEWQSDDNTGAGGCYGNYATTVMAGNMFDYPVMHGHVLSDMHISYVSTSVDALLSRPQTDDNALRQYTLVDLILGKQRETSLGTIKPLVDFKTFPTPLQDLLRRYADVPQSRLLVSGAYIGSDMNNDADRLFLRDILHSDFATAHATTNGQIVLRAPLGSHSQTTQLQVTPDPNITVSEDPDGLKPYGDNAKTVARYHDTQVSAATFWTDADKNKRTLTFAFPLESTHDFYSLFRKSVELLTE